MGLVSHRHTSASLLVAGIGLLDLGEEALDLGLNAIDEGCYRQTPSVCLVHMIQQLVRPGLW